MAKEVNSSGKEAAARKLRRWQPENRGQTYTELEHAADLFLEIRGPDLASLYENALFALYDQLADLNCFGDQQRKTIQLRAPTHAQALRALLAEALYLFAVSGFVATGATVTLQESDVGEIEVTTDLQGETFDRTRHTLLTEIKAVTYHRLAVNQLADGSWQATVLFDV